MTAVTDAVGVAAAILLFSLPGFTAGWLLRGTARPQQTPPPRARCHICGVEVGTIYCGTHLPPAPAGYRRTAPQLGRGWPLDIPPVRGETRAIFYPEDNQ